MRGCLAVTVLLTLIAAPAARGADAPALTWSVSDRLQGRSTIDETAPVRPLTVRVGVDGACSPGPAIDVDGRRVAVRTVGRCSFELPAMPAGDHEVAITDAGRRSEIEVDPRDLLVVSIGDSVASGEGNPDAAGPTWLEPRCHRSLRSGAAQAARAVELGDRHSAITLVPLGCSGATIDEGLLKPYAGIDPDPSAGPLAPQLDVVERLSRKIDALMVSVGANDVHFGALVRFCMAVSNCPDRHFDPDHPTREAAASAPTVAEVERAAIRRLHHRYDALAARLQGHVDPGRIVIVEYFDSLRDEHGDTCTEALPGIDVEEASWAQRNVLAPLNAEVHAVAARSGWQLVGGVAEAFARHGICADPGGWIRRPEESALGQLTLSGTLHPNADGHIATATLIAPVLASTLGVVPGSEQLSSSHEGYVRWPWLIAAALVGAAVALGIRKLASG